MRKRIPLLKFILAFLAIFSINACNFSKSPKFLALFTLLNNQNIDNTSTHTVGGEVTGLSGTLALQLNGTETLSITSSGSFVFLTRLTNESNYSVTIFSQPTGQTCTVSNGSGLISSIDIDNVSVSCINGITIGGTVSGLSGTVVLQNNGADNLTLSANGNFSFSSPASGGSTYSVTILTQPAGQVCSIANGSGTISTSGITNISLVCSSNSYTVSGTISGLAGTIVIQNNNTDNLSLTTSGNFTFPTSVANGATYSVSILTQPIGQTCTSSGNSGTVSNSNISNVSITCTNNTSTFTVGGSIAGLTGTVVLQNNSSNDLTITTNGNFTFSSSLVNGSSYTVSILTQPSGQTCTVSNNTGTIASVNITNVSIICSSNAYTVGGTVSGLTGTLVLQNNSGNNLTITTNGNFVFTSSLTNSSNYSVSVLTQPTGQSCTLSNNSGTINSANITNVTVSCANTYTVGGTLSGYSSGTVLLQNNGGNNLSLTANGNFTFSTSLVNGASYSVTVLTPSANRTCIVSNGTGTISSANVTNITVTCTGNANGSLVSGTIINTLTLSGGVTTFVGAPCAANTAGCANPNGYVDSTTPSNVRFKGAEGITTDGYNLYIAEKDNRVIRKVVIATGATTTLAGDGTRGFVDGTGTAARLDNPEYLVTDGVNIYVADKSNKAIRKIEISTGVVSTIISNSNSLQDPKGMVIYNNKLYVGDNDANAIQEINLSTNSITTVVTGINDPVSMTLVGTDIYIADKSSDTIKKTTIGTWTVSTFAGTTGGFADGTGTTGTRFNNPLGITTDGVNLYVSDSGNHAIRKIVISTGVVTTLSGTNNANYTNSSTANNARFDTPHGITSDGANLFVVDENNNAIRLIQ